MATPENRIPEDEIDLRSIGYKIYRFFAYPIELFFKNIFTTLAFVLAAVMLAIACKYLIPKTYRSSFIIRPNDRTEKFHLRIIGDIQILLKQDDYKGVARELKIEEDAAKSIAGIRTFNPHIKNRTDSINNTEVTIETDNPDYILTIQKGLLDYLENIPYFKKIHDLQVRQIDMQMDQVNHDLFRLDSLKKLQLAHYNDKSLPDKGAVFMNDLINPTATYTMTAERMNRKSSLIAQREFLDNFQLIKSCVKVSQHSWPPRILWMCVIFVPAFLLLCFIFLHIKTVRRQNPA